jgi:hypothetical protein
LASTFGASFWPYLLGAAFIDNLCFNQAIKFGYYLIHM